MLPDDESRKITRFLNAAGEDKLEELKELLVIDSLLVNAQV